MVGPTISQDQKQHGLAALASAKQFGLLAEVRVVELGERRRAEIERGFQRRHQLLLRICVGRLDFRSGGAREVRAEVEIRFRRVRHPVSESLLRGCGLVAVFLGRHVLCGADQVFLLPLRNLPRRRNDRVLCSGLLLRRRGRCWHAKAEHTNTDQHPSACSHRILLSFRGVSIRLQGEFRTPGFEWSFKMGQSLDMPASWSKLLFVAGVLFALSPWGPPPLALVAGLVLGLTAGNPFRARTKSLTKYLLQASVVGLGFGMDLYEVLRAGRSGFLYTAAGIAFAMLTGSLLARVLRVKPAAGFLISTGTAICGGSAIAAVGPVAGANDEEMSVALGTVFILNSLGLLLFPPIGMAL